MGRRLISLCLRATSGGVLTELLLDTDVFIDHLRGAVPIKAGEEQISYSVITRCELFAGTKGDEEAITQLLGAFRELTVDRRIAETAGRLRREHGVAMADAVIAATALTHGLTLHSRNRKHFEPIPKLDLVS